MVEEINISKIAVSKISFDDTNPNILTKEQMKSLKLVMEKFGFLAPVILNKDLQVIDGEHRVRVYQELGKKTIPAYVIDLNTINKKMLRQLMNKLRGEHDKQKDAEEFKLIFEAGKLNEFSNLLAAQTEDFQSILERKFDIGFEKEEQEVPGIPDKPKSKLGDVYQLGNHRIMCGDNQISENYNILLKDEKIAQFNTDPPYGVMYGEKNAYLNKLDGGNRIEKQYANDETDFDYHKMFTIIFKNIPFADYNTIYIWSGGQKLEELRRSMIDCGLKFSQYLIWLKNNHVLTRQDYSSKNEFCIYGWKNHHKYYGGFQTTILEYNKPTANKLHPTQKPVELISHTISDGTKKGDNILDVFLGSGTSLIACEQTGRICYGMELDPGYIDVIIERWENYTGKKAKKV